MCARNCTDTINRSGVIPDRVGPSPIRPLWMRLKAFPAMYRDWRRRTRLRGYLAQMTDYELMDIGISRADAERESNLPFWHRMELGGRRK